jgi:TetR/AcrR family transcriptional regulator, tetracycline repressor protein
VISAARTLADREGLGRLSMRTLAAELGVMPNTLYSHVDGKAALLDGLLDSILSDVEVPDEGDWRERLVGVLDSSRAVLLEHPGLIEAFLTHPTRGENATRLGAECLALLARGGIEGELAVRGLRALLVYTIGFAAFEAPRREDPDPRTRAAAGIEAFRAAGIDRAQAERLAAAPTPRDFRAGLGWMLDGLVAQAK